MSAQKSNSRWHAFQILEHRWLYQTKWNSIINAIVFHFVWNTILLPFFSYSPQSFITKIFSSNFHFPPWNVYTVCHRTKVEIDSPTNRLRTEKKRRTKYAIEEFEMWMSRSRILNRIMYFISKKIFSLLITVGALHSIIKQWHDIS